MFCLIERRAGMKFLIVKNCSYVGLRDNQRVRPHIAHFVQMCDLYQIFRIEEVGILSPWNPEDPKHERKRTITKVIKYRRLNTSMIYNDCRSERGAR